MRTTICEICKQVKPVDAVKYVMRGNKTITACSKCSGTSQPSIMPTKAKTINSVPDGEREDRRCLRCNYKYRQNTKLKIICPNCGKGDKTVKV